MEKIIFPKYKRTRYTNKEAIIVSSRVCISRNIDALAFPAFLSCNEKISIEKEFHKLLNKLNDSNIISHSIKDLDDKIKNELISDLLITNEFKEFGDIFFSYKNGNWILLPNEKDHFHIFSIEFGLQLKEIYKQLQDILMYFDDHIHFAFHSDFGYINSHSDNSGNCLSLSVLLNLCGLELQGEISELITLCSETGYHLQPLTGKKDSKYYYLKNQGSFGISELEHITKMMDFIQKIQNTELVARYNILEKTEDRDFFSAQLLHILSQESISYNDTTEFIALIEMLKPIYRITNREQWQEQLFRLQDNSSIFSGLQNIDEINHYRLNILNQLFINIIKLK